MKDPSKPESASKPKSRGTSRNVTLDAELDAQIEEARPRLVKRATFIRHIVSLGLPVYRANAGQVTL